MGLDYTACFRLAEKPIDAPGLEKLHRDLCIECTSVESCDYEYVVYGPDNEYADHETSRRDPKLFYDEISRTDRNLKAQFIEEWFFFDLGFAFGPPGNYAILEISDKQLWTMENGLEPQGLRTLEYFAKLFHILGAESMALGLETWPVTLISFLDGKLSEDEISENIRLAIGAPLSGLQILRKQGAKTVTVLDLEVVGRWLPGCDELMPDKA